MSSPKVDPVHRAVMRHNLQEVSLVIAQGEDTNSQDQGGRTPLFYAIQDGDVSIADELIRNGGDVNAKDKGGKTPLHFAATAYQLETADLLLRHGAEVDAQDAHGNTPLFDAVFRSKGRGQLIGILIAAGADKSLKNKHGVSPEELAKSIANFDVSSFFRTK